VREAVEQKVGEEEFTFLHQQVIVRSMAGRRQNNLQTFKDFSTVTLD
jgi:hypothetical protein